MTRYFCDLCGDEVQSAGTQRMFVVDVREAIVSVQITRAINGRWNAGHICNACFSQALALIQEQLS